VSRQGTHQLPLLEAQEMDSITGVFFSDFVFFLRFAFDPKNLAFNASNTIFIFSLHVKGIMNWK
jgi:hypothetical protein